MFITENVPALFKKGALKLEPTEDGNDRVAEATCVIEPFTPALARELGEEIAGHLFDDADEIRPELEAIDLRVKAGYQVVTVQRHRELKPLVRLSAVSIKDVVVERKENKKNQTEWLACSFVLVFALDDKAVRNFVIDEFGSPLLWSFVPLQRDLLDKAARKRQRAVTAPEGDVVRYDDETSKAARRAH